MSINPGSQFPNDKYWHARAAPFETGDMMTHDEAVVETLLVQHIYDQYLPLWVIFPTNLLHRGAERKISIDEHSTTVPEMKDSNRE
ncbi:uncharacterized protein ARMOST_06143 [Armillaria ostoyae]|uniref:Uncharacterized protein n=1 Tax=Armillaria ostoyae TaxID=47428 RepID=A0A284R286_ARMOS|nr:uncharacterized protein ARMOST_06143 [Armillaria ostoyae]